MPGDKFNRIFKAKKVFLNLFYFNNSRDKLIYYVIKLEPDSDNKPSPAEF